MFMFYHHQHHYKCIAAALALTNLCTIEKNMVLFGNSQVRFSALHLIVRGDVFVLSRLRLAVIFAVVFAHLIRTVCELGEECASHPFGKG